MYKLHSSVDQSEITAACCRYLPLTRLCIIQEYQLLCCTYSREYIAPPIHSGYKMYDKYFIAWKAKICKCSLDIKIRTHTHFFLHADPKLINNTDIYSIKISLIYLLYMKQCFLFLTVPTMGSSKVRRSWSVSQGAQHWCHLTVCEYELNQIWNMNNVHGIEQKLFSKLQTDVLTDKQT